MRPPWRADRKLPAITVNVVLVREINPPPGEEPVEWLLLTSLPVDTIEQVRQIVQYYCVRWMMWAIAQQDPAKAKQMFDDLMADFREGGVCECINEGYRQTPSYVLSATNPLAAARRM